MPAHLPRFCPIIDASSFSDAADVTAAIVRFALDLAEGGATLIQYRNKIGNAREMLSHSRQLRLAIRERARLIMNDRTDLCLAGGCDGVHLGQDDLSPDAAREIFQRADQHDLWIGVSTHNAEQLRLAARMPVDYIAIGPVFGTISKANPDPVIGLEGVHDVRQLTEKPLVAIGGITRRNCVSVINAGADAVAVISDVVESPRKSTAEFLRILG